MNAEGPRGFTRRALARLIDIHNRLLVRRGTEDYRVCVRETDPAGRLASKLKSARRALLIEHPAARNWRPARDEEAWMLSEFEDRAGVYDGLDEDDAPTDSFYGEEVR